MILFHSLVSTSFCLPGKLTNTGVTRAERCQICVISRLSGHMEPLVTTGTVQAIGASWWPQVQSADHVDPPWSQVQSAGHTNPQGSQVQCTDYMDTQWSKVQCAGHVDHSGVTGSVCRPHGPLSGHRYRVQTMWTPQWSQVQCADRMDPSVVTGTVQATEGSRVKVFPSRKERGSMRTGVRRDLSKST